MCFLSKFHTFSKTLMSKFVTKFDLQNFEALKTKFQKTRSSAPRRSTFFKTALERSCKTVKIWFAEESRRPPLQLEDRKRWNFDLFPNII